MMQITKCLQHINLIDFSILTLFYPSRLHLEVLLQKNNLQAKRQSEWAEQDYHPVADPEFNVGDR